MNTKFCKIQYHPLFQYFDELVFESFVISSSIHLLQLIEIVQSLMSSNNTNKRRSSGDDLDNSSTTSRRKNETTQSRRFTSTSGIKKQRVNNSHLVCQGCEFTFTTKKDLIAHKLGSESSECQEGLFPCQYCTKCFLSITGLNMHVTKNPVCLRAQSLPDIVSTIAFGHGGICNSDESSSSSSSISHTSNTNNNHTATIHRDIDSSSHEDEAPIFNENDVYMNIVHKRKGRNK